MSKFKKHPSASKSLQSCSKRSSKKCSWFEAKHRVHDTLHYLKHNENYCNDKSADVISLIGSLPRDLSGIELGKDIPDDKLAGYQANVRAVGKYLLRKKYPKLFVKVANALQKSLAESDSKTTSQTLLCLLALLDGFYLYSEQSPSLSREFGELGGVEVLLQYMTFFKDPTNDFVESNRILAETTYQTSIVILHNCIRLHTDNRVVYRKANAVETLSKLAREDKTHSKDNSFHVLLVLVLAYIVDEQESEALTKLEDCVRILTELLNQAVQSEGHFAKLSDGYSSITLSTVELLGCLNRLAINDTNKTEIEKHGGIPTIIQMLQPDFSEDERKVALDTLWKLSFVESIKRNCGVQASVKTLQSLTKSSNQSIREASSFALWEIQDNQQLQLTQTDESLPSYQESISTHVPTQSSGHVMISYQWGSQARAICIRDKLIQAGYNVWMDVDKMRGDILAAMADAVERADVVLICMTELYKDSSNCRSEASYASKTKKPIIPLLMEADYKPDGWLGILLSTKLYYKFCSHDDIASNTQGLINEIGERGRCKDAEGRVTSSGQNVTTASPAGEESSQSSTVNRASEWSQEKVQTWLQEIGLSELCEPLDFCDGNHLEEMYEQYKQSPDTFRSEMKTDLQLNFRDLLKLTTALGLLFKNA